TATRVLDNTYGNVVRETTYLEPATEYVTYTHILDQITYQTVTEVISPEVTSYVKAVDFQIINDNILERETVVSYLPVPKTVTVTRYQTRADYVAAKAQATIIVTETQRETVTAIVSSTVTQ
ncbi:unnamed protein product, partial [Meganyctiphanes norvegica]